MKFRLHIDTILRIGNSHHLNEVIAFPSEVAPLSPGLVLDGAPDVMKKSKVDTAATRRRIVEVAAKTFKTKGISETGVAEVMAAVGMTHGGFYRHFESKDQLVAEACATSMEVLVGAIETAALGGPESLLKHLEDFLTQDRPQNTLAECPLVAMGSEIVRADADTRRAASRGFESMIAILTEASTRKDVGKARDEALVTMSTMIGAVTMARIVDDPVLSEEILDSVRRRLPGALPGRARARNAQIA